MTTPSPDPLLWRDLLSRSDPVWEVLPQTFDHGAFAGNGVLGATLFQEGPRALRCEVGRSDVTEHRRDNNRLPVGGLVLETNGVIRGGSLRIDLWNAEIRGVLDTDRGRVELRCFVCAERPAIVLEFRAEGGATVRFRWAQGHGQDKRNRTKIPDDPPNPPALAEQIDGLTVGIQPRFAGGEYAATWVETPFEGGTRAFISVADSFPGHSARREVVALARAAAAGPFEELETAHRAWWHARYPRSFVSVPDATLESFYWIQLYKLASASRPSSVPVDLMGPWFRETNWPRVWWNMNIEVAYLPVYTANQLELGESLVRFLDAKRENFRRNAKEMYGLDDAATTTHTTCYEGLRGDGSWALANFVSPGDFVWALHNYWLHYRHGMDHALAADHTRHALFPLLRAAINLYLHLMREGGDGRLHLPVLHSPEYGDAADSTYNLALFRWGCRTLLDLDTRYGFHDPLRPRWQDALDRLTPYPVDETGFRIGADVALEKSHRHWSHLLMVHPLHMLDLDDPENRARLERSIAHWLTVDGSQGIYAWSRAGAASLYAALGDGDRAIENIHLHMADQRFVQPNTMYIEMFPVLESSLAIARSLQDMLLQSHGGTLWIFPAVPAAWTDAVFHDFRAEGAFLVSALRAHGRTQWVRIRSLAGEQCRVRPGLPGPVQSTTPLRTVGNGLYEIALAAGEEALLWSDGPQPQLAIAPISHPPGVRNPWGVKSCRSNG
jgi:hypothetical protein